MLNHFIVVRTKAFPFSASADSVFFAAFNVETFPISSDEEVIAWNTAVINPGGNYDTLTGAYTAPVHGFYQFSVQKESDNYRAIFKVFKEGVLVLYNNFVNFDDEQPVTATSFILELQAGERVQIYNDGSTVIYGAISGTVYRSWFSGYLLYGL